LPYIDLPTRSEIMRLSETRAAPAVTIYLATTPLTQAAQADRIALKNLAKAALSQLEAARTDKRSISWFQFISQRLRCVSGGTRCVKNA
jgi:hypothetical protein